MCGTRVGAERDEVAHAVRDYSSFSSSLGRSSERTATAAYVACHNISGQQPGVEWQPDLNNSAKSEQAPGHSIGIVVLPIHSLCDFVTVLPFFVSVRITLSF